MVSESVGYDGGKKIKGRKRHLLVDSLGYLLVAVVTAANISEGAGLRQLLERAVQLDVDLSRLWTILVDGGYVGENLVRWGDGLLGLDFGESFATEGEAWIFFDSSALVCGENFWLVSLVPPLRSRLRAQTAHG